MDPTDIVRSTMPLCAALGVAATDLTPDRVVLHLDRRAGLCPSNGVLHGGVVMTLADAAGASVALLNLPDAAAGTSTIESQTDFLGRDGRLTATATPLHTGRTTIVVETEVRAAGKLVATTTPTQAVLQAKGAA